MKCANCGVELNEDGTSHYNDILFCAFATPLINWTDQRTARKPEDNSGEK
jgi:hypothetical protein